jgi:fructose-bisphosphate aldolase class I
MNEYFMNLAILKQTALTLLSRNKGILAADESEKTCAKRFEAAGVPCTEENRRLYRQLLFTTPEIEKYLSGVILFDETIRQKSDEGVSFPQVLSGRGIIPGIKVDAGTKDLALHQDEKVTEGLDGLRERLAEYKTFGAQFAKWRAVITIGQNIPTNACIHANAHAIARYAALCQEADILPIVEPEVLIDGDHSIERSYEVTRATLKATFSELAKQDVAYEGIILKSSMVLPGKNSDQRKTSEEIGKATVKCLRESVPENLAGVVFLSGGQTDEQATANLHAINKVGRGAPRRLTFSFSRAIQNPVLKFWAQKNEELARKAYVFRVRANSLASEGTYDESSEPTRPY